MEERIIRLARWLGPLALATLAIWLAMVIFVAPVEKLQGVVQKIFYVHVPCAPPAYLGFVLTALAGIGFLTTRKEWWDRLAQSAAEVGVLFCTLIIVSGPIWAKPVWGNWWAWDLRLTTTLVLWFIYLAYLFLRAFAHGSDAGRSFAAIYGIAGTIAIPFVVYAVDLARGDVMHPADPSEAGLPPAMAWTLRSGMTAFLILFAYFVARRLEIAQLEARRAAEASEGAV